MKFSKIINIIIDQHTHEKLIVIDEIYNILSKKEYTIKWNLKKSLQANQGGKILRFGRECATVISLLKYLFNNKTSTYCKTLVKQIEEELVCKSEESCDSTTLNLYHLIAQCKVFQSSLLFETLQINECNIPTLVTDYKTHFNDAEWRIICWFENHVSNTVNCSELSFKDTLKQKFSIYENILKLLECGKSWIQSSKKYLQNNALRVKSSNEFDVTLIAEQRHLATVVDCDIKTLLEIYCPESVEDVVTFHITNSRCSNFIWVAIVQNKSLEINYQDVCQRIFYRVKKKHHVYIERIILVEYDSLKKHVSKDGVIQRFTFRDVLETGRFNTMLDDWRAGECIDGSCEISESGILANCNRCFSDDHKILTVDTFDIVHEWFLQLPHELLEQVAVSPVDMIVNDQYISENLGTEFPSQEVEDIHEETDKSDTDSYTSLSAVIESAEFEGESILEDFDMSDNEELSDLGKSFQDMSILEESIETSSATITHCLQSFGFKKFQVPALLCRHPSPAIGRDDDLEKIREILDDVLVKAGYEADPNKTVNRILCGPDNKIGKCLFQLQKSSNRYIIFLPEFPLLHLRKSKINILFSAYKDAGLVQLLKFMRDEDQDDWAKLVSIQHIDTATKYVKRIALALHLAFLIAFTQQLDSDDSHALLTELESEECSEMSKRWAAQFEEFLSVGCTRNATFALHFDMMRHCDDIIAIAFAERLGGETGYDLLLAAVKNSLLYLFVNGASSYAPYCVNLLHSHYSAGHFHQCLKHALYSTPFKGSNINFACDTKREMDHLDVVKGFRSGSNIEAVTCRMSLIDSLNETQKSKDSKEITTDDDCLGMKLSQIDTNHIYPTTALILRRGALSLNESLSPSNVYTKVPLLLPTSILDVNSLDVGSFLLRRFLINEKLYNIKSCSVDESNTCIKGSQELIGRAKRSKGVTIKRTQKAKVVTSKSEREMKEDKRKKEVGRKTKIIDAFSSENNNCQALLKPDSSKPKVAKSIGIQRALKNLILSCPSALPLDSYMSLNASHVPSAITQSMKICTVELAGLKFKLGNIKSGKEYMQTVAGLIDGCCKQSKILSKVVLCEEKYHFTPDDFKAETRNQRKTMSLKDVQHLKTDGQIVSESSFNKDAITKTQKGKNLIGKYAAQNISKLNIKHNIQVIIDSELYIEKDCKCLESCSCKNSEYCIPVVCTFNENGESTLRKMSSIKQRKGEAEMSVLAWTVHLQSELKSGENVVCYVTSSDIDTVYIYAYGIERFWARNEDGSFRNNVYVVLQKSSGKNDIYNITAILTLLEQAYNDLEIGMKLAFTLSMGGNDFLPKFYYISHDTVLQNVFDSAIYRTSLFSNQNGKYQLDKRLYVSLIQYLYTPKRFRDTSIQYEDVRAMTISKQEDSSQRGGFKTSDPKKWLPPKSVIERVSELVQFQIEYLETVGSHDSVLPNFCSGHVLVKGSGGEIEYNFGPESRFLSIEDLPKIKNKKKKRTLTDTPQHGARRKKQLTSTPKSK
ncbi:hypothetical protein ACF0H5_023740 [Mactra antiquata]